MLTWRAGGLLDSVPGRRDAEQLVENLDQRAQAVDHPLDLHAELGLLNIGDGLLLHKQPSNRLRVFFTCRPCDGVPILCFLGVFTHEQYDEDNDRRAAQRNAELLRRVDDNALKARVTEARAGEAATLPPLPPQRVGWLTPLQKASAEFTSGSMVYETRAWTDRLRRADADELQQLLELARAAVAQVLPKPALVHCDGWWAIAETVVLPDPAVRATVLHDAGTGDAPETLPDPSLSGPDDLARDSRRAYPADRLDRPDAWLHEAARLDEVHRTLDPCLPLSREELAVLDGFTTQSSLPLFLDGPAGSGKSSLLGLLMATLVDRSALGRRKDFQEGIPLFVTYSDDLCAASAERLERSLRFHFGYDPEEAERAAKESVRTTAALFRSLLPPEELERFDPAKRVRFAQFRDYYNALKTRPDVPAEQAWYAIRSFIKGRAVLHGPSEIAHLDEFDFAALPDDRRDGLDPGVFRKVHDFFKRYEDWLTEAGRWDDQDLALAVLGSLRLGGEESQPWMAIICDEAQDLTKAELAVLMRLLGMLRYDLTRRVVPLLFAADPSQTVNPSGFTWAGFTSSFYDETAVLFGAERAVGRKPTPLQLNYRSQGRIVELAGAALDWRRERLGFDSTSPTAWNPPKTPVRRLRSDRIHHSDLATALQETLVVIVPCDGDDIPAYVRREPALRAAFAEGDGSVHTERVTARVRSASQVKGLEFERAVVYGFGAEFGRLLPRLTAKGSGGAAHKELDFLLNGLYVALTRARTFLHFCDDEAGEAALWGDSGLAPYLPDGAVQDDPTGEHLGEIRTSVEEILDLAAQEERLGLENGDADQLAQAAANYERAGAIDRAERAHAWAAWFRSPGTQTLARLVACGLTEEVERRLVTGERWHDLALLDGLSSAPTPLSCFRRAAAEVMTGNAPSESALRRFAEAIVVLGAQVPGDAPWPAVMERFCVAVVSSAEAGLSAPRRADLRLWKALEEGTGELCTGAWEARIPMIPKAHAYASAVVGDDQQAIEAAHRARMSASEIQNLALMSLRTLTGLWFAPGHILLEVASTTKEAPGAGRMVAIARRAMSDPAVRSEARRQILPLPEEPEVAAIVADAVLADSLTDHLTEANQLLAALDGLLPKAKELHHGR
jgi:hypothetical protein